MATVNIPNIRDLDPKMLGKLMADLKRGIEGHDLDTGWQQLTSPYTHRMIVPPKTVSVHVSDDPKGNPASQVLADSFDHQTIAFTTAKKYVRILANK